MSNYLIAELLFPTITKDVTFYEETYPERNLPEGAIVTRFAPSPTGFVHLGSTYTSFIAMKFARQSGGVFFLRIEDTDKKREVEDGILKIIQDLSKFGISFDEGPNENGEQIGNYGPYIQSQREEIYKTYVKMLIKKGLAYPCFCSHDEIEQLKNRQEELGELTGYYGKWAKCRNLSYEEIQERVNKGESYVIRLRTNGDPEKNVVLNDLVRGELFLPENNQDIVLLKADGIPTYHFAHVIDDHLMRTTHVIRGEEWLASASLHVQLFNLLDFKVPFYAHISPLMKQDGKSKRKLSKRKDSEVSLDFYDKEGYPNGAVIEYLLTLANSKFEEWRIANPHLPIDDYKLSFENMSVSGALFDIAKLGDVSKNFIGSLKAEEVTDLYYNWALKYEPLMAEKVEKDREYFNRIFSIDRGGEKPRKDISKWSEVREYIKYFFDDLFEEEVLKGYVFENIEERKSDIYNVLKEYSIIYCEHDNKDEWFERIRFLADNFGYARDIKEYKKNKQLYNGHVGDVATMIRIAVTNRKSSPDLYSILAIIGKDRLKTRIGMALKYLERI